MAKKIAPIIHEQVVQKAEKVSQDELLKRLEEEEEKKKLIRALAASKYDEVAEIVVGADFKMTGFLSMDLSYD